MTLSTTHLIFLALLALFFGGYGAWMISGGIRSGNIEWGAIGVISVLAGCASIACALRFASELGDEA